jgi:hypothetical protein
MGGNNNDDLIWGVANIGREIGGLSHRKVVAMLESGQLPANQVGEKWVASRALLRKVLVGALDDRRR